MAWDKVITLSDTYCYLNCCAFWSERLTVQNKKLQIELRDF